MVASCCKQISFIPYGSYSVTDENGNPLLQLGLQAHQLHKNIIPTKQRGRFDYYLLRVASTFGKNDILIEKGIVKIELKTIDGMAIAHDMYPRREYEIQESEIEIGLDASLTWGALTVVPKATYKTKIRRIDAYLVAGGLLTKSPWWRFEARKGERSILGVMETLLTVQVNHGKPLFGNAKLIGYPSKGWFSKPSDLQVSFSFEIR